MIFVKKAVAVKIRLGIVVHMAAVAIPEGPLIFCGAKDA
jgi:hypothetical protein